MNPTRRTVLAGTTAAVAVLALGCRTSGEGEPTVSKVEPPPAGAPEGTDTPATELSAWIAIDEAGAVDLTIPEAEMGQGSTHALAQVLADELEVPFDRVTVHLADADARFGRQSTGGSSSIRGGHDATRQLGASARAMLVAAAAARWGVDAAACTVADGAVSHPDHGSLGYGALVADAARQPVPDAVTPKAHDPAGLPHVPRWDLRPKVDGTAIFGLDVRVPDMVFAAVARPEVLGQTLASVDDDSGARALAGVIDVVRDGDLVAVLARDTWTALQGRDALKTTWQGGHPDLSTETVRAACDAVIDQGEVARDEGDVDTALAGAATVVEATYEAPYLAHAAMEPLSCTAHVRDDGVEVWVATQSPTRVRTTVAEVMGLKPEQVTVHATFLGGGFGRRSNPDYVVEAVRIARAAGRPVQLVWSREEDIRGGRYRPFSRHRLRAGLDADGRLVAWEHRLACPKIRPGEGIEGAAVEGARNVPYAALNVRVTAAAPDLPVTLWYWRSVGSSQNAWVTESFIDEVAEAAGADPVQFRLGLLADKPRHARALKTAAEKAGWGGPLPEGHAHGVAVHESFGSFCAQVVEVSLDGDRPVVHKVTCVLDPGQVVTPDAVEAQVHSAIVYALSATLWGRIDLQGGRVTQGNFHDYRVLRFDEMPAIDVTLITEGEPFGGVGEPPTPPLAPALDNALRRLRGTPTRTLPVLG